MAQILICSKLPRSFILELVKPGQTNWPLPTPETRVEIRGANSLRLTESEPSVGNYRYAQTPVDESLWRAWLEQNNDLDFIKKGFVFESKSIQDARAIAKERVEDLQTGIEPLASDGKDKRLKSVPGTKKFEPGNGVAL
jgi:hypothetical protein